MTDVTDRLKAYNGGTYDAATNPRGFAGIGGMDANWAQALNDVGDATDQVATAGGDAAAAATSAQAAAASATAAASSASGAAASAVTAEAEADRAQAAADGVSGGPVVSVNGRTGVVTLTAPDVGAVDTAAVGAPDGVAALGPDGHLIAAELPDNLGDMAGSSATISGDMSVGGTLSVPQALNYTLVRYAVGQATVGASHTLDLAAGAHQALTLTDDTVITLPDPPAGFGYAVTLKLIQDAIGGRTPAFQMADATPARWASGAAPTWRTNPEAIDRVILDHDGTDLIATHAGAVMGLVPLASWVPEPAHLIGVFPFATDFENKVSGLGATPGATSAITSTRGKVYPHAAEFLGRTTDVVTLSSFPTVSSKATIAFWHYRVAGNNGGAFAAEYGSGNIPDHWAVGHINDTGKIRYYPCVSTTGHTLPSDVWQWVLFNVHDNTATLWIDGVQVITTSSANVVGRAPIAAYLGDYATNNQHFPFRGSLQDVLVWNGVALDGAALGVPTTAAWAG